MPFTTGTFDRRLAALERAEAGRFGRPLSDGTLARVAFARRQSCSSASAALDPAAMSRGPSLLLSRSA